MNQLLDDITDEPHETDYDWEREFEVLREFDGRTLKIPVRVGWWWVGGICYSSHVARQMYIGNGLCILADTVLILSEREQQDFSVDDDLTEYIKECHSAADDEKAANNDWDKNR